MILFHRCHAWKRDPLLRQYHPLRVNLLAANDEGVEIDAGRQFITVDGDALLVRVHGNLLLHLARHVEDVDVGLGCIVGQGEAYLRLGGERVGGVLVEYGINPYCWYQVL